MKTLNSKRMVKVDGTVTFSDGIVVDAAILKVGGKDAMVGRLIAYAKNIWRQRRAQDDDTGGYRFSRETPPEPSKILLDGKEIKMKKQVY